MLHAGTPASAEWHNPFTGPEQTAATEGPSCAPAARDVAAWDALADATLNPKAAAILKRVFLTAVLPSLSANDLARTLGAHPPALPRAAELAELLVAKDQGAAFDLIEELRVASRQGAPLIATLFEPAARSLGDLWSEDVCSEFDVTLGLCRLQAALRLLSAEDVAPPSGRVDRPVVLIAPEPGELHRLGAALDGAVLRDAGWAPDCRFPSDDDALDEILASTWFDVLDLSLSVAFRREHLLPRVAKTIAQARLVSRNPALVVVIGGRVFAEERAAGLEVGADQANTTALNVNRAILRTLTAVRTSTACPSALPDRVATPS